MSKDHSMTGNVLTFSSCQASHARSAALANTALILARSGASVLVVDWDLDGQGLPTFFDRHLDKQELERSLGLVGLLSKARGPAAIEAGDPSAPANTPRRLRDLSVATEKVRINISTSPGLHVDLLPVGREHPLINEPVAATDWDRLLGRSDIKANIDALSEELRAEHDYVLIDQGSGSNRATRISYRMRPDVVVMCFALNELAINKAGEMIDAVAPARLRLTGQIRVFPVPVRLWNAAETEAGRIHARRSFDDLPTGFTDRERDQYWQAVEVDDKVPFRNDGLLVVLDRRTRRQAAQLHSYERLASVLTRGTISGCRRRRDDGGNGLMAS